MSATMREEMIRRMENALHIAVIENGAQLREAAIAALDEARGIFVWPDAAFCAASPREWREDANVVKALHDVLNRVTGWARTGQEWDQLAENFVVGTEPSMEYRPTIDALCDAVASCVAGKPHEQDEIGWVITRRYRAMKDGGDVLRYLSGFYPNESMTLSALWTENHLEALRFAGERDAKNAADKLDRRFTPLDMKVEEHMWTDAGRPSSLAPGSAPPSREEIIGILMGTTHIYSDSPHAEQSRMWCERVADAILSRWVGGAGERT